MSGRWEIWLDDPLGNRLALLDRAVRFELVQAANDKGSFSIWLPQKFNWKLWRLDGMVEFWRAPTEAAAMRCLDIGLLRRRGYDDDGSGIDQMVIGGPDRIELLDRRIVAYAAGEAEAEKTDYIDDIIKALVRENLGSLATDTARDYSSLISVAADLSAAPSTTRGFSKRKLLGLIQDLCEESREGGTELYFDLAPVFSSGGQVTFHFETFTGQLGQDRTTGSGSPVHFGKLWGNLARAHYAEDYGDEVTYMYAGGKGEGTSRVTGTASDTTRMGASPWNRREGFADARNEPDATAVAAKAAQELEKGRPRFSFSGTLLDTSQARYGLDWSFGDRITCDYQGMQFDGMITKVRIGVSEDGEESIEARVEVEST